jgi:hypothetical protein
VRRVFVFALCFGLLALAGGAAAPRAAAAEVQLPCGLPDQQPLWVDYSDGSVPFWSTVFARPGVVAAAANLIVPPQLRSAGAKTVYFDLKFHARMGSPSAPVDPARVVPAADTLFNSAVKSADCATPLIALNELFGAQVPTPWTPSTARYRANVLTFVQRLAERGARPFLLLSSAPYAHGDAADWWRQAAQYADLVPEVYFNGPAISRQGAALGSRRLRSVLRARITELTEIGIPPSRIGVMLTFSSTPRTGGREGLQPLSKWLDVVKWESLAAKAVASETGIASVWSWGWGSWSAAGNDPDKPIAACVWLWTRDPALCDAPTVAADVGFDPSLTVGGTIPEGAVCVMGKAALWRSVVTGLTRTTGDADIALSAALQRLALAAAVPVATSDVLTAERAVILDHFRGVRALYMAALARAGTSLAGARAILADELRRNKIERHLRTPPPSAAAIAEYYAVHDGQPARMVTAESPLTWLGNRRTGVAVAGLAPGRLFKLDPDTTTAIAGVKMLAQGETAPLGAFPLSAAAPSIRAALVDEARSDAFLTWSSRRQNQALPRLECVADALPQPTPVDLTDWLPYLALH